MEVLDASAWGSCRAVEVLRDLSAGRLEGRGRWFLLIIPFAYVDFLGKAFEVMAVFISGSHRFSGEDRLLYGIGVGMFILIGLLEEGIRGIALKGVILE
jgi:hypothetical protein